MNLNDFFNFISGLEEMLVYDEDYMSDESATLLFTLKSDFVPQMYLKDKFAKAKVIHSRILDNKRMQVRIEVEEDE